MLADRVCTSVYRANPWGQERKGDRDRKREGNSLVLQTLPSLWSYPRARRFKWGGHGLHRQRGIYRKKYISGCLRKQYSRICLKFSRLPSVKDGTMKSFITTNTLHQILLG
jgi:hypothetical protein